MTRRALADEFLRDIRADVRPAAVIAAGHGVSRRTVERWRYAAGLRFGRRGQGVRPGTHRCTCPDCGVVHTAPGDAP